jgi:hypothetical protein
MRIATASIRLGPIAIALAWFGWLVLRATGSSPEVPPELPPWFGDANRPAARIAGKVIGAPRAMTVHLLLDVPDPMLWKWRRVRTSPSGEFDFGPTRAGRYRLFADGNGWLARVVEIDTLRGTGDRTELFAHEWSSVSARLERFGDGTFRGSTWDMTRRLSTGPIEPWTILDIPVIGTVLRDDGAPAAAVGVQPIACSHDSHSLRDGMSIVSTTTAGGGFAFVPHDWLCGVRVLMGATMHEVELEYPFQHPTPQPLVIRLPPAGREQLGVFDWGRREHDDPRGAWLRGRVVRDGVPVGDVDISAYVLPFDCMEVHDDTRSRADGSFDLFVSSDDLDKQPHVVLYARETLTDRSGWQVIRARPGHGVTG